MTMLQHGLVPSTGGYQIERSLRFNSADSAYLNRTPASAGNRRTWTWSGWVKRSKFGDDEVMFSGGVSDPTTVIRFSGEGAASPDGLRVFHYAGSFQFDLTSTAQYRDPSAWYHIVVACDTTQATSTDRLKIYVNGVQVTAFDTATYPSLNYDTSISNTVAQNLGRAGNGSNYLNGYMTEVHFIDGSTPTTTTRTVSGVTETVLTQFGEFDTDTGVWKPKAYSGSYGTNGFYLKFADNSGTTSTTLGKDSSGNGNNWTPNNFSVTAGAGNDSLVDTPTPYGTDTGAGGEVRGNYCTLNPLAAAGGPLANGNLDIASSGYAGFSSIYGTIGVSSGKWYWEVTAQNALIVGVGSAALTGVYPGQSGISCGWNVVFGIDTAAYVSGGITNNVSTGTGSAASAGDVIGVALDMDAGTLYLYRNGTILNSGNAVFTTITGSMMPAFRGPDTNTSIVNFGQRAFAYTPRSGHKALCTQNLPTPTIGATATTRADDYFNTVLYTGTGSTQSITSVGFQPDFIWFKRRDAAASHALNDSVRGVTKSLTSNGTDSEYTSSSGNDLVSFNSTGFTVGPTEIWNSYNVSGGSLVAWNWNAGGSNQTISVSQYSSNVPSIASTVRANTTAGFSIVTYTGNGTSGATVGHGLGATPEMLIFKNRDATDGWIVFQKYVGGTDDWWDTRLLLASTAARADNAGYLTAAPTSTLLTLSNTSPVNTSSQKYLVYCFAPVAGYSAFGSYTGNGSADGPFVYTGFRPRYIMIKRTDTSGTSWVIFDTARNLFNSSGKALWADLSDAEATYTDFDILSNGFKLRFTSSTGNASGGTYVYAAFAESPFKYSLAR